MCLPLKDFKKKERREERKEGGGKKGKVEGGKAEKKGRRKEGRERGKEGGAKTNLGNSNCYSQRPDFLFKHILKLM